MPERKPEFSRREFLRAAGVLAGGAAFVWGTGEIFRSIRLQLDEQNSIPANVSEQQFLQVYKQELKDLPAVSTPTPEATPEPQATPEPPKPKIDFWNADAPVSALIKLPNKNILIPPFRILTWGRDIDNSNLNKEFAPLAMTGLMFLDNDGRPIIWAHSGSENRVKMTMRDVQLAIEKNDNDFTASAAEANKKLKEQFIGASVDWTQSGNLINGKIIAAVRVPPQDVQESINHKRSIVDWLGQNYPGYGFENLPKDAFVIRTCGERLTDPAVADVPSYEQTRYFFGFVFV